MFAIILAQLPTLLLLLYIYVHHKYRYWSNRGIPGPEPRLLALGNLLSRVRQSPPEYELDYLRKYGKVYGMYRGLEPTLCIVEPELIKQVMIKDFGLFMNRSRLRTYCEYWNENLFHSVDDKWKRIRSITSPTFTSGKLRGMHRLMSRCVGQLANYLDTVAGQNGGALNLKQVIAGFTIDVIALTSFATETNANGSHTKRNAFVENGLGLFQLSPTKVLANILLPKPLNRLLGVKYIFRSEPFEFFLSLAKEIVKQRKADGRTRNDLVQLLMDAYVYENQLQNGDYENLTAHMDQNDNSAADDLTSQKKSLTDQEVIAQCVLFFVAGFETTASTLTHCIYELACNEPIQCRLVQELTQTLSGLEPDSEQYFESVMSATPYLEAVVKETLRKYPSLTRVERHVGVNGYRLAGVELTKGQVVEIPIYAVHHNPEYYPEPEQFNPDRFLPSHKHTLVPYSYLPFGLGPRNCVGMRFAYQEMKLCLAQIVTRFRFYPTEATPCNAPKFKPATLMMNAQPFEVGVAARAR